MRGPYRLGRRRTVKFDAKEFLETHVTKEGIRCKLRKSFTYYRSSLLDGSLNVLYKLQAWRNKCITNDYVHAAHPRDLA